MTCRLILACAALALASAGAARAGTTTVHALTIGGQASGSGPFGCATSGPHPGTAFHGSGVPVPVEGHAGCGLAGGVQSFTSTTANTLAHSDLNHAFNGGVNTASADARAGQDGSLGAQASESYIGGATDGFSYLYSEAGAIFADTLDYGGSGMGYVQWIFGIDGTMTTNGLGDMLTRVNYQVGAEPIYTAFVADLGNSFTPRVISGVTGATLTGFTITPNSISGADSFGTFVHAVDLSNPFDFRYGLYTAAYAKPNAVVTNDFFNTLRLTGIRVYDASGNALPVHFTGTNGAFYDETGLHLAAAVPEPSQWALMILGFGLVGLLARRRHPGRRLDAGGTAVGGERRAQGAV